MSTARVFAEKLLTKADITINGDRSSDIQIHNERLFGRVLRQGSLGFGEAYMDGWWDTRSVDELISKILSVNLERSMQIVPSALMLRIKSRLFNLQSKARAFQVGEAHYDLGNDLYEAMLDKRLTYTCGYWKEATTLNEAQEAKLDLVCRKINLKRGDRVLDIGCGWGSFAKFAAEKYDASIVGITISKEQVELGKELCKGLPIELRVQDYRDVNESFDHIVSLGMFEHVGVKNYETYFDVARRCLKEDGLFLLHTIGRSSNTPSADPWVTKYIFPNGMLPSIVQIGKAINSRFVIEDWHNFGADYDKTLMAWFSNFDHAWSTSPTLQKKYGDRFYRMWKYYLLSCAGLFRARKAHLWQIVLSKNGLQGGYNSVR